MKKFGLLLLCILSLETAVAATQENVIVVPRPKIVNEGSSEHNRMNQKMQITGQLLGVNPNGIVGTGLTAGYFLDRNSMIIAEATSGKNELMIGASKGTVQGSTFGLHYKRFFGNSFYMRGGLDQRNVDYNYQYKSIVSSTYDTSTSFKATSTAAALVIGNQWQWESFTLGCDWIGLSAPIATRFSDEKFSANADSIDRNRHRRDKEHFGEKMIQQGLKFYLGASF